MRNKIAAGLIAVALSTGATMAQDMPFGTDAAADYAADVWTAMVDAGLAGDGAIMSLPYDGTAPHGRMLETFFTSATIGGHTGTLVVKRNYGPMDVTREQILANPSMHLGAVTVMFRREAGYDEDNGNWFWAKFMKDGSLAKNPKGMRLAGRVAKGMPMGCIACHTGAPGGDYLFTTDQITE